MGKTYKFGGGTWARKKGSTLAYNDEDNNFKPLPFSFERNSIATRVNKEGLIEVVSNDVPRIDYTDSSEGALLLEDSATNLIPYSEDFTNAAWVKYGVGVGITPIVTPNYAISPDGTQNASRLQCDLNGGNTTSDRSWLYQTITTISGDNTFSLYVKNNSNEEITFTLSNGSSETVVVLSDDKWHRLSTVKSGGGQPRIGLIGGVGASDNADLLIYGAQAESGNVATSYIPTNGSTVQRAAETANGSGNSEVFNDSEGVLFAEISQENDSFNTISVSDGGTSDRITIAYQNNTIKSILVHNNNVVQLEKSAYLQNLFHKVAIKYTSSNVSLIINGFELLTASRGAFADTLNTLQFAQGNGGNNFYGKTKQIGYYDTVLTDAELETLTSYRSLSEMVTELNLNTL